MFADHGDPVSNVTLHRSDSHSLLRLTLASPAIAWAVPRLNGPSGSFRRWRLALWLALFTHPLLDLMTVYGTQLLRPLTDPPYAVGSLFIIDPLYTLPLLGGLVLALALRESRGLRWNHAGLALSSVYPAWSVAAQQYVESIVGASLARQGIAADRVPVAPPSFNTVLWRVVAMIPTDCYEGFCSLLEARPEVRFDRFDRGAPLHDALNGYWHVERVAWFTDGFFAMTQHFDRVLIIDMRMGREPAYMFSFIVGERVAGVVHPVHKPRWSPVHHDITGGRRWMARRITGHVLPPPR